MTNEMLTLELDIVGAARAPRHGTATLLTSSGPSGWPVYRLRARRQHLLCWLVEFYGMHEPAAVEYLDEFGGKA